MANYNNADYAYILPDRGLTDAQKIGYLQNQRQLDQQNADRVQQQQQRQENSNLSSIKSDLDWKNWETGDLAIDKIAKDQLQNIYNDALQNHLQDTTPQLQEYLQGRLQSLSDWHLITKNGYAQAKEAADNFSKVYKNSNPSDVKDATIQALGNVALPNGQMANPDNMTLPDFNSYLHSPQVFPNLINDVSPLNKWVQEFKPQPAAESNYVNNKGHVVASSYTAGLTPFSQWKTDVNGNRVGIEPKVESLPVGNDKNGYPVNLNMLPQSMVDMMPPDAKAAAAKLWYDTKDNWEKSHYDNGGQPLSPVQEDMMQRAFLNDYIQKNNLDQSYYKPKEIQKEPKITLNVGNQSQQQQQQLGNWTQSVIGAAKNNDNATVNRLIDEMYSGNGDRKLMGTYTKVENGQPMLYIRTQLRKPNENQDEDEKITAIPANADNAQALLLGEYQNIMGSNTKAESLPFRNTPVVPATQHSTGKKKIQGF